jgi:hypothetical protein
MPQFVRRQSGHADGPPLAPLTALPAARPRPPPPPPEARSPYRGSRGSMIR